MQSRRKIASFVGGALSILAATVITVPALASSDGGAFGAPRVSSGRLSGYSATNATSPKHAGWQFTPKKATTSVTAEFKAPTVKCTSTRTGVEPGVGMATGTPNNTESNIAGVSYQCYGGKLYMAGVAQVDNTQTIVPKSVVPGDVIRATVTTSATTTTATIADTTKGHTFTVTKAGAGGTSFRELVFDDSVDVSTTQLPVADFGSISFSAAAVGGTALGSVSPPGTAYSWESSTNVVKVVTGALTGTTKNAFTTTWKHS